MMRKRRIDLTEGQDWLLCESIIQYAKDMSPIGVRGLYYQAVLDKGLYFITKDTDGESTNYDLVQRRALKLRRQGVIPWESIVDESRPRYELARYPSVADFAEVAPYYYRLDYWKDQCNRPILLVEKAGQVPIYLNHARSFGVDVAACKGYGSASFIRRLATELIQTWLDLGQSVHILVAADFDPSGWDWPRAAEVELRDALGLASGDSRLQVGRVLVGREDLEELGEEVALRPPNSKDPRIEKFCKDHSFPYLEVPAPNGKGKPIIVCNENCVVEMDAMNPNTARKRLEEIYLSLFDGDIDEMREEEREHREEIEALIEA